MKCPLDFFIGFTCILGAALVSTIVAASFLGYAPPLEQLTAPPLPEDSRAAGFPGAAFLPRDRRLRNRTHLSKR